MLKLTEGGGIGERRIAGGDVGVRSFFFFQAEDGIRDLTVTGVQTCALPISNCTSSVETCRSCNACQADIVGRRAFSACSSGSLRTYGFSRRETRSLCSYGARDRKSGV